MKIKQKKKMIVMIMRRWKEEVVEGESDRRLWQKIQAREVAAALEASPLAAAAHRNHHHPNTREVMVVQTCCEK